MHERTIGTRQVGAIGLGTAGLSILPERPDADEGVRIIHAALDAGVTLFDTATCYVPGHLEQGYGEALIVRALREAGRGTDEVIVASKAGLERTSSVRFADDFTTDTRPETIRAHCETSLKSLGVERIGLYQLHSPDDKVPLAETMGAFRELQDEGKIDLVGISNVDLEQLEVARAEVEIASVQNRFSPGFREGIDVLHRCAELGIAFLPYSPLGGLGQRAKDMPNDNPAFVEVAAERQVSPHQVALAWELSLADVVIPIPSSTRPETIRDSARAADLELSADELSRLGS
jgi:aryl-alcohol dehydrogenase-like predicted oxidoreductase